MSKTLIMHFNIQSNYQDGFFINDFVHIVKENIFKELEFLRNRVITNFKFLTYFETLIVEYHDSFL